MTSSTRATTRLLATVAATSLVVAACAEGSDDGAVIVTDPTSAASDVATTEIPDEEVSNDESAAPTTDATAETTAAPTPSTEPAEPAEPVDDPEPVCPAPIEPQLLEPADLDASPVPAEGVGMSPGRYSTDLLGVSVAFDVAAPFSDGGVFERTIGLFQEPGPAAMSIARPSGFLTDVPTQEEFARGAELEPVGFETWLADSGVEIVTDVERDIDGYPVRDVEMIVPASAGDEFGEVRVTPDWVFQADDSPARVAMVDLGEDDQLVFTVQPGGDTPAGRAADATLASMTIGGIGLPPSEYYADTPWDAGNLFRPVLVGACTIPALAMGGVEFVPARPALLMGQGNQLWFVDPDQAHTGLLGEPTVIVLQAQAALSGGQFGPPTVEGPIETITDAVAQFEASGYTLTETGGDATLLGAPATTYDFVSPAAAPFVFVPGDHEASNGNGFMSLETGDVGTMQIAETDAGVVVVTVGGEQGTDDVELMRDQFDAITASLRFRD